MSEEFSIQPLLAQAFNLRDKNFDSYDSLSLKILGDVVWTVQ